MELFEKILDQKELPLTVNPNGNYPIFSILSDDKIKSHIRSIDVVLDICSGDSEVSFIKLLNVVSNTIHDIMYCDFSDNTLGYISSYIEQWNNTPSYLLVSSELFDSDPRFRNEIINVVMPINPKRISISCIWTLTLKIFVFNDKEKKAYMLGKKVGIGGKNDKGYSMAITNVSSVIKILSEDSISY